METVTEERLQTAAGARRRPRGRFDRRLLAMLGLSAVIVAGLAVAAVLASRSSVAPPATGAAAVVPANALAYAHLSTDLGRPSVRQAIVVIERFPGFLRLASALGRHVGAVVGGPRAGRGSVLALGAGLSPWLGKEAAFAVLGTTTRTAGSLIVLAVRSRARAQAFLAGAGATPDGRYDGVPLLHYRSGAVLAFVRHYLVGGQRASVRAAIDVADGRSPSLQDDRAYRDAAAGEPADRALDLYLSASGVRRLLVDHGGLLGALGVLIYQRALTGTTISVSATPGGARVRIHGALNPALARLSGAAPVQFAPTLASVMPSGSTLLLDVHGLDRVASRVLGAGAEGGVAARIGPLLGRLGAALASEGVDVPRIVSIFSGESAIAVVPTATRSGRHAAAAPALVIVARTQHQAQTSALLAQLEGPLAQLFPPPSSGPGQAPEFSDIPVAGVTVRQLSLAPGLAIDYSVFRGLVVVSTSVSAIAGVARHASSLADDSSYQTTLGDVPGHVTSLLFLDFNQLLSFVEQAGLIGSAHLAALRPDLQKIRAIGLASTRGESDTTSELLLQIP